MICGDVYACKNAFDAFKISGKTHGVVGHREAQTIKFINWGTEGGVCVGRRGGGANRPAI